MENTNPSHRTYQPVENCQVCIVDQLMKPQNRNTQPMLQPLNFLNIDQN